MNLDMDMNCGMIAAALRQQSPKVRKQILVTLRELLDTEDTVIDERKKKLDDADVAVCSAHTHAHPWDVLKGTFITKC